MKNKKAAFYFLLIVSSVLVIQACTKFYFRSNYTDANKLLHETKNIVTKPFLKAHLKNGDVWILKNTWQVDTVQNLVTGFGVRYNFNRTKAEEGLASIFIDSVAIFETNQKLDEPEQDKIAALSLMAGVDVVIGILCALNPKACFGSCPTFYINEKDNFHYSDAEGFSNAILPSLEYSDIDALNNKKIENGLFSITMKNEALETHCVNDVKLLAFPKNKGERIYQSNKDNFYRCENNYLLTKATGDEGDITTLLAKNERQERFSFTDETNLSSKEELFLNFENVKNSKNLGLILNFRQTLMTTYFIYSSMGYMGDEAGDILAKAEGNTELKNKLKGGIKKELGNIDVYMWDEQTKKWIFQDGFFETGPIAINRQIIPLKNDESGSTIKLKLVINKGLWRMDYAALTNIKEKIMPLEILPASILNKGKLDNRALGLITDPDKYLISMPGCEYNFNFLLPDQNQDYELFLCSKGYYLEWMREHWIKDKNLLKLKQMIDNPKRYLKVEAKEYKLYETTMEQEFWNSKIDTKTFTYYEK